MAVELRGYQSEAVAEILAALASGQSALLVAPTGSGKTVIFSVVAADYARRGLRVLVIAHRKELLTQAARRLADFGVEATVYRGKRTRYEERPVVVASVQTGAPPGFRADLVIVDEGHHAPAKSYRAIVARQVGAAILGATATPWWQSTQWLTEDFAVTVKTPGLRELTEAGYLARVRMFTHPHTLRDLDLRGVATAGGDYAVGAVSERADKPALIGDMVEHWKTHAAGERALVFAASVTHSEHVAERFRAAGIAAEHLDGDTPESERDAILQRLASGETLIVSSYAVLAEGLDVPAVGCVILARPTRRLGVYRQIVGRGLRRDGGKDTVVVLDHAGSCLMHGLPDEERDIDSPKQKGVGRVPVRRCPECGLCVAPSLMSCPECTALLRRGVPTEEPTGALVEVVCSAERALFTHNGKTMELAAWASELGVPVGVLRKRLARGMPLDKVLSPKVRKAAPIVHVTHGGETMTIPAAAKALGMTAAGLRHRLRAGYSAEELFRQKRTTTITHEGKTLSVSQWAAATGLDKKTIRDRLRDGLPASEVLRPSPDKITLTHDGRALTVLEWSDELGIAATTIRRRLAAGESAEDVLGPLRRTRGKLYTRGDVSLTLTQWAHRLGISSGALAERIEKWPLDVALSRPKTAVAQSGEKR